MGRRIAEAKQAVIELYDDGYVMPVQRKDIKVFGRYAWVLCMQVSMECVAPIMQPIMM